MTVGGPAARVRGSRETHEAGMTAIDGGQGWAVTGGWPADAPGAPWHSDETEDAPRGGALRAAGHWLGAACSIGLVAGIAVWGWQTVTREAQGVPIVRALAGEMRVAPETAGGAVMPDQGLTLGTVQEGRGTAAAPEAITLAPTGTDIAVEDRLVPVPVEPARSLAGTVGADEGMGVPAGLDDGLGAPLPDMDVIDVVAATEPGVAASPRPSGRPAILAALAAAMGATSSEAAPAPAPAPAAAAPEPDGAETSVRLGDFSTEQAARDAWSEIAAAGTLTAEAAVIESVGGGDRDVWRLRATGFEAGRDAARFCSALRADGMECVSVDPN